ncbi:uncharacterized protein MELLADRAFT_104539 [Melampsora larici-populina 98AG31]|uniref:Uncharacterized protein n=1 Tax=Melampsora larici-populina (strain 98AG31 / pathotype 3-4-7) TaxID=747676 RepID=F4RF12_MELLP|nr:uncharacterized protein MELLADRAFT_104539 [Melampsora larici-populina 98AG31]EGG09020.1 hypothetical protein MELLADRAFT_104539 [Melampsora larici-populina 98AG31]
MSMVPEYFVTHKSVPHSQRHCDPECSAPTSVITPNSRTAPNPASTDKATQSSSLNLSIYNTQRTSLAKIPLEHNNPCDRIEHAPTIAQKEQSISKINRFKHTKRSRDQLNTAALLAVNKFDNSDATQNLPKSSNIVSVAPKINTAIQSSSLTSKADSLNPLRDSLVSNSPLITYSIPNFHNIPPLQHGNQYWQYDRGETSTSESMQEVFSDPYTHQYQTFTYSTQHTHPAPDIPHFSPRTRHPTSTSTQPLPISTHQAAPASALPCPQLSNPNHNDNSSECQITYSDRLNGTVYDEDDHYFSDTRSRAEPLEQTMPPYNPASISLCSSSSHQFQSQPMSQPTVPRGKYPTAGPSRSDQTSRPLVSLQERLPIAGPSRSDQMSRPTVSLRRKSPIAGPSRSDHMFPLQERSPSPLAGPSRSNHMRQPTVSLRDKSPLAGPSRSDQMRQPTVSLRDESPLTGPSRPDQLSRPIVSLRGESPITGPSRSDQISRPTVSRGELPIAGPSRSDQMSRPTVSRGELPISGPSRSTSTNHTPSLFTEPSK